MAVKSWAMDNVKWVFEGNAEVDENLAAMVDWRSSSSIHEDFLRNIQNVQRFHGWTEDPLRAKVSGLLKTVQDWHWLIFVVLSPVRLKIHLSFHLFRFSMQHSFIHSVIPSPVILFL